MKLITRDEETTHPMEDFLDITPCTTVIERTEVVPSELIHPPTYDDKDVEIESQLEEIYTIAMNNAATLGDEIERVEGKYKARMGEVSSTMLNVALGAVREKANLKKHKDQHSTTTVENQTINNNLVVADRNEILRHILRNKSE